MHAYLLLGGGEVDSATVKKLLPHTKRTLFCPIKTVKDARELGKTASLSMAEQTCIVVEDIDKASLEAQNSFLKKLEEPASKISFILTAKSEYSVLETIASRCQVVYRKTDELAGDTAVFEKFMGASTAVRLMLVSKITKRDDALLFAENLVRYLSSHASLNSRAAKALKPASVLATRLTANTNPTLQLTWLAVNI